ncbi:MAG: NUDIX domain-containing protein [Proteobacteria bacterium]|nr:NUDIX domain-containing protein [Pseudomonadota bacterium]
MPKDVASGEAIGKPSRTDGPAQGKVPDSLLRHLRACRNAVLPGRRTALRIGGAIAGWVTAGFAVVLRDQPAIVAGPDGLRLAAPELLPALARGLAEAGHFRWRGEAFDVRADPNGPALAQIDRGALPAFGIAAVGVHVNGLVEGPDGPLVWVARRAANKSLDPGKLDHLVAGGVPAGLSPAETLVKEAAEEAAIPAALAATARPVATIDYAMERPEGLRRDRVLAYDLVLPEGFRPRPADGEVESFDLWPLMRVVETVRRTDDFKFNVNLVLIDLFLRRGMIGGAEAGVLRAAL